MTNEDSWADCPSGDLFLYNRAHKKLFLQTVFGGEEETCVSNDSIITDCEFFRD